KGIEDLTLKLLGNPDPSVGDCDTNERCCSFSFALVRFDLFRCETFNQGRTKRELSPFGHRVQGVEYKVDEHLFNSRWVNFHCGYKAKLGLDTYPVLQKRMHQFQRDIHEVIDLRCASLWFLGAAVAGESLRQ